MLHRYFITRRIFVPLEEAATLAKNNRHLYDVIEKECQRDQGRIDKRLEEIEIDMQKFMEKNKVWDRQDLLRGLSNVARNRGNFVCLLGGKSTGKSLVLKEFSMSDNNNETVFYIDMREHSGILQGLVDVLSQSKIQKYLSLAKECVKNIFTIANLKTTNQLGLDVKELFVFLLKNGDPNIALKTLIENIIRGCPNEVITLVVDEANIPLAINDRTREEKIEQVKTTLSLFTTLTKQQRKINAILVSSEHAFPFRLADPILGFNLKDINEFLYAGEVPPIEMYALLTDEWKLSENFSLALISLYGGHI